MHPHQILTLLAISIGIGIGSTQEDFGLKLDSDLQGIYQNAEDNLEAKLAARVLDRAAPSYHSRRKGNQYSKEMGKRNVLFKNIANRLETEFKMEREEAKSFAKQALDEHRTQGICPVGCDCMDFSTCNWSIAAAQLIGSKSSNNDSELMHQAIRIKKYTCNVDLQAVCCCGSAQLAPDLEQVPTDFNRDDVSQDRGWWNNVWGNVISIPNNVVHTVVDVLTDPIGYSSGVVKKIISTAVALQKINKIWSNCVSYAPKWVASILGLEDTFRPLFSLTSISDSKLSLLRSLALPAKNLFGTEQTCIESLNLFPIPKAFSLSATMRISEGYLANAEIGYARGFHSNGKLYEMGFLGGCYGLQTDVGASLDFNLALWRNLDDIPGESFGTGLAFNLPVTNTGVGVSLIMSNDDHAIIGVVISVTGAGGGVGLSTIDLSSFMCDTPYRTGYKELKGWFSAGRQMTDRTRKPKYE